MTARSRRVVFAAFAAALAAVPVRTASAVQNPADKATSARFQHEINDYLALRWRATRELPPLPSNAKLPELVVAVEQQVRAVRRARDNARNGDIFRTDVAALIRRDLLAVMEEHAIDTAWILEAVACDAPRFAGRPRVNDRLPWLRAAPMPEMLVDALPPLPFELRYRFLERDLILLDVDLGLVVDVLPDALPPALIRR